MFEPIIKPKQPQNGERREKKDKKKKGNTDKITITTIQDAYLSLLAYMVAMCLAKLSLITQYCRIFIDRHTRLACHLTFGFTALFSLSTVLAAIFSCTPVTAFWNWGTSPTSQRHCINYDALWYVHGAVNILTDFIVLLLPVPALYTLHLPWRQKLSSGFLFAFGSFGCLASIVRLYELWRVNTVTVDSTYSDLQAVWCAIELAVCIVCVSATGLPPLYYDCLEPFVGRMLGRESRASAQSRRMTTAPPAGSAMRGSPQGPPCVYPYPDSLLSSRGMDSSSAAGSPQKEKKRKKSTKQRSSYLKVFSGWKAGRRGRQCGHSIHSAEDDVSFGSSAERSTENVRMGDLLETPAAAAMRRSRVGEYAV